MVYFIFVWLFVETYFVEKQTSESNVSLKPKIVSVLFYNNLKSSFLHDSQIWLWGFFTLLVALAHGVPIQSIISVVCKKKSLTYLVCKLPIHEIGGIETFQKYTLVVKMFNPFMK